MVSVLPAPAQNGLSFYHPGRIPRDIAAIRGTHCRLYSKLENSRPLVQLPSHECYNFRVSLMLAIMAHLSPSGAHSQSGSGSAWESTWFGTRGSEVKILSPRPIF